MPSICALLDEYKANLPSKKEEYYQCTLIYCESCTKASLCFELYEFSSKKQLEKTSKFTYNMEIDNIISQEIIDRQSA